MQTTNNLGLKKPGAEDVVNIEDLNSNSDVLDGKFGTSSGHGHTGAAGDGPKIGSSGLAAGAATDTVIGSRTVSDAAAPTGDSGAPTTLFGWLANMIKAITGGATWRTLPGMTIAAIKTILDAATNAGTASTLMKRDANGRAQVSGPLAAGDIANKGYVDTAVSGATIPDASLTVKGKVQLSSVTNSTSEALAATPKAVKDAYDRGSAGVTAAATAQSTANAVQTRANNALPKDGSEPMTGQLAINQNGGYVRIGKDADHAYVWNQVGNATVRLYDDGTVRNGAGALFWTADNDGAGSGLDADTLDGVDSSRIVYGPDGSATTLVSDFNAIDKAGFYRGNNAANAPSALDWNYVIHIGHDPFWGKQIGWSYYDEVQYVRTKVNGTWGEWKLVGGATYVASNTIRDQNLTEYTNMVTNYNTAFGTLIYKFIPRFTGEINVTFEARGHNYRDGEDNTINYPAGLRVYMPTEARVPFGSSNDGVSYFVYAPGGNLPFFDTRTPIGTKIGGAGSSAMAVIYQGTTYSGTYDSFAATISVHAGVPVYFFAWTMNNASPGGSSAFKNFRIYYDIV
nr:pyocin knob domain-containing protein [Paenibacillus sp. YN15]